MAQLKQGEGAIQAYDEALKRFGDTRELALRELVAQASFNKASALKGLSRVEEATRAFQDVIQRFGSAQEESLKSYVEKARSELGLGDSSKPAV